MYKYRLTVIIADHKYTGIVVAESAADLYAMCDEFLNYRAQLDGCAPSIEIEKLITIDLPKTRHVTLNRVINDSKFII